MGIPTTRTPWLLALVVFPVLGTATWYAAIVVLPDSPDSVVTQLPLKAIPYLLTFAAPPVATLAVTTHRRVRLAARIALAAATLVLTWVLVAAVLVSVFAIACSGTADPCL